MDTRAARLVEHGKPLEVTEVTLADPGPGEVVVELLYAGVNPLDRYATLGRVAPDVALPRTVGVEGVGRIGDRHVLVHGEGLGLQRDGTWAGAVVVPEAQLVDVPAGVELPMAASMGVVGTTAWLTVHARAQVTDADRVLVLGASGGVGSAIVALAAGVGATVWGQTGSDDKAEWIRARGAEQVVVGDASSLAEQVAALQPTVVLDPLGGGYTGAAIEALAPHGRLVVYGTSDDASGTLPLQQLSRKGLSVLGYSGFVETPEAQREASAQALEALRQGHLEVVVDRVVPLASVNEAVEAMGSRSVLGKVVLDLAG